MYAFIIEFIYFRGKYRGIILFTSIFRDENSKSLYFPLLIEELYYRGIHWSKSTSIIEFLYFRGKYKDKNRDRLEMV